MSLGWVVEFRGRGEVVHAGVYWGLLVDGGGGKWVWEGLVGDRGRGGGGVGHLLYLKCLIWVIVAGLLL